MSEIEINSVLTKMRAMAAAAQGTAALDPRPSDGADFKSLMSQALETVNATQQAASRVAGAFERGDKDVDIAEVMVALQKADVSFQAITHVRNRLVSAYQDIMNMPI